MRDFTARVIALSSVGPVIAMGEKGTGKQFGISQTKQRQLTHIGKRTLEEIRDMFREELYEKTIPLWKEKGVDWKYGGFLPYINEKGEITSYRKRLYHQGRVLWLYSYFYNNFDNDEYHLRAAKAGFDFLTKHCLLDKYDWCTEVTREGEVVTPFFDIYASIYMILGLGEYYRATGLEEARDLAVKTAYRVNEIILSPHYQAQGHGPYYEPGTVRLGTWLHFLSTLTPLLKYTEEEGIEKIARMCVKYMLRYHWQPDIGLAYETLQHNLQPHPNDYLMDLHAREVHNFHSLQAAWMCMDEALRVGSPEMFGDAMNLGHSLLEKCWLERNGKQGLVRYYWPDDPDPFVRARILDPYVMNEVFVFCLLALEHTREDWTVTWFDKAFSYSYETPLEWPYGETLHHPRGIMFCIQILDRMISRSGRVSNFIGV